MGKRSYFLSLHVFANGAAGLASDVSISRNRINDDYKKKFENTPILSHF
jgi:hypothetical protein